MKLLATFLLLLATTSVVFVSGCDASGKDELGQWMQEQKNQVRPRMTLISEPKQFKPEAYALEGSMDPFSKEKLTLVFKRESAQVTANGALMTPELTRRKEALEALPLDEMSMVGSLTRNGQTAALIKVETFLYQVRIGNYLGQNYGRVVKISETNVTLRELVQDAAGVWIERPATLHLQGRSQ
jgi:type IV pilus assembly protein PilP